ncbi:hypothetical protein [Xanthomonas campestris]|uniref:hypothetical protein n=2 Tax=Xanthomonas campestris TaxID=339 RepID=UPI0011AF8076|nr:hypothetical protein [Xanthomonas campestris]MCW1984255.1 hypothetical protein [Xanthomonas campestris]MCW2009591.1 hypothetical protein [Xanthomonas campestris]MEB2185922.1 hypothetical protein [Xanthomonas campestris pv. campestris]TXD40575.1 hypothetical protein TR80_022150 [Xanthomonas campestris]
MPSTTPYDPALVLGNLVEMKRHEVLAQIAAIQAPADAAKDMLNALIVTKRSLDMTSQEVAPLGIDTTELDAQRARLSILISEAADSYAKAKEKAVKDTQALRAGLTDPSRPIESSFTPESPTAPGRS